MSISIYLVACTAAGAGGGECSGGDERDGGGGSGDDSGADAQRCAARGNAVHRTPRSTVLHTR